MIEILLPSFLLSIILLGIHSYFGLEIIKRGIIFTDLAIGQMAALGAAASLVFFEGQWRYPISLLFAVISALLISYSSKKARNHEAFIGLLYAVGISGVFLLLSKSPHGMEEFQKYLASDILFTQLKDLLPLTVLYSFIGISIFFLKKKLSPSVFEWVFFIGFSLTVTSSVQIAGVLVVFSILIAPALIALHVSKKFKNTLFISRFPVISSWIIGLGLNLAAILLSYFFDFPTGYTLVFIHAFFALIVSILI